MGRFSTPFLIVAFIAGLAFGAIAIWSEYHPRAKSAVADAPPPAHDWQEWSWCQNAQHPEQVALSAKTSEGKWEQIGVYRLDLRRYYIHLMAGHWLPEDLPSWASKPDALQQMWDAEQKVAKKPWGRLGDMPQKD